jgi:hypothetical protein
MCFDKYSRLVAGFSPDGTLLIGFAIKSLGRAWTLTILAVGGDSRPVAGYCPDGALLVGFVIKSLG